MRARARCVFYGRVQGVYFRAHCRQDALDRGLTGSVRNLPDGTVAAVFEGEKEEVEAAIAWNHRSQPYARVKRVDVTWSDATGEFRTFVVDH